MLFLLDCIENPPEEDEEEQVADAFLNMILSFNQHFKGTEGVHAMHVHVHVKENLISSWESRYFEI